MAIFGRRSAPRREQPPTAAPAVAGPTAPVDCSAWVIGGLWPAELTGPGKHVADLAEHLQADLKRIAETTNGRLAELAEAGLTDRDRRAAETELTDSARQFAIRRVASTVRQLQRLPGPPHPPVVPPGPIPGAAVRKPRPVTAPAARRDRTTAAPALDAPVPAAPTPAVPVPVAPAPAAEITTPVAAPPPRTPSAQPRHARPPDAPEPPRPTQQEGVETDRQRLQRLLAFVARQQPALGWQVGITDDRVTVLATDLAYGWIPPGVDLPAGVRLPGPGRHTGAGLLGPTTLTLAYRPGDRVGPTTPAAATETALTPRHLAPIPDLSRLLTAATETRPGLPRLANTLVKAAAAGTGVAGAEIDLLRVQLDTMLYRLIGDYPAADAAPLADCALLAAATAIATGDALSANYHFAWFQALLPAGPPVN